MPLPKTSKSDFMKALREKPLDDIRTINLIESELKKRGGVFKMPKPGSSVILLLSGGLDSIVSWAILMEEYKLKVYPIVIKLKQNNWKSVKKSIAFFSKYYKKKYDKLFVEPFFIQDNFPQIELGNVYEKMNPLSILEKLSEPTKELKLSFSSISLLTVSKSYSNLLYLRENVKIDTVFCGILPTDGDTIIEQCFTSIRCASLYLRVITGEDKWQFASICYEKEIGNMFYKKDLIKWAFEHDIPIESSWSCFLSYRHHCGQCHSCWNRRANFEQSGVVDRTKYRNDYWSSIFNRSRLSSIQKKLNKFIFFIK